MSRTAGRSPDATKRQILDAAARLIGSRGTAVPVAEIAEAAGVSKGGLLYHYPSKEDLLHGLATDLLERFRALVMQTADAHEPLTDDRDPAPGRLTRAYIRVSLAEAVDLVGLRDYIALAAHLMFEPHLVELATQDAERWREMLLADGLDESVVRLVVAAADGGSSTPLWGAVLNEADLGALEADLIALTYAGRGA